MEKVLIATRNPVLGDLIQFVLEDHGGFQIILVHTALEARAAIERDQFSLAILDPFVPGMPFNELLKIMKNLIPSVRWIIILPGTSPDSNLSTLKPDAWLPQPFYSPQLIQVVQAALKGENLSTPEAPHPTAELPNETPTTYQDVPRLAQQLTRLLISSSSQAALVTRGNQIWAYAGQLPEAGAREVAELVHHHWKPTSSGDLVRFLHLSATNHDVMLYATRLSGDFLLALVYDVSTPLSQIRAQAIQMAQALSVTNETPIQEMENSATDQGDTQPIRLEPEFKAVLTAHEPEPSLTETVLEDSEEIGEEEIQSISVSDLLGEIPAPNPTSSPVSATQWVPEESIKPEPPPTPQEPPLSWDQELIQLLTQASQEKERNRSPRNPTTGSPKHDSRASFKPSLIDAPATAPSDLPPFSDDTQPVMVSPLVDLNQLEPASAAYCLLSFTCVLIPCLPRQFLTGEVSATLSQALPSLCISFGWKLERLSVRPEYLMLTVQTSPGTSPAHLINTIRQRTSQHLLARFPEIRAQHPGGDFWAPGFLVINGSTPISSALIHQFLIETRRRQGSV